MIWANINHCPKKIAAHNKHDHHSHNSNAEQTIYPSLVSIPEENHKAHNNTDLPQRPPSEISDHCNMLENHDTQYKSNIVIYADCHASSRGLFGNLFPFSHFFKFLC
jgi:hypothetical protein